MRICFPVQSNEGQESRIFEHFGSAGRFLVFDTEAMAFEELPNRDHRHMRGACQPLKALGGTPVDAVVVGAIGAGAFAGLSRAGLKVYRACGTTVGQNISALEEGSLEEVVGSDVCVTHGHGGHGCGHGPHD